VAIRQAARPVGEGHFAYHGRVEDVTAADLRRWGVTTVYADPPYTAQQYSRFYHLLDTIVSGCLRPLQRVRGAVTSGLYPDGRYLSPYCSRRNAPAAFMNLAEVSASAGARLVISYSGTPSPDAATGNARSVTIRQLVECVSAVYAHTTIVDLS